MIPLFGITRKRNRYENSFFVLIAIVGSQLLFGTSFAKAQETTKQFTKGSDTLVVYSDVPGLAPSEFYTIKVRSAATNDEWKECYANITRSLWSTIPIAGTGNKEHYYAYVKDWSHTYANIEMSRGSLVEVQISAKNGFKIKGSNFTIANAHPAQKASKPKVVDNVVYFTINNPGQITIDINGQMDETNTGNGYSGPPIHTVSLFANPVIDKPSLTDPAIFVVEPGVKPPSNFGAKTTLYFKPGVHDIGRAFTLLANKNYYIPGDAIVYGTLYNGGGSGASIRIYGYGTLSGDRIKHYLYDPEATGLTDKSWKLIWSENCSNFRVDGISLMNCPKHTANLSLANGLSGKQTFVRWVKIVTWRSNGDGIGVADEISDCFFRTQDDCCYVKGDRLRTVFWTDVNGSIFSMAGMDWAGGRPLLVEDCDIIYPRHCSTTWNGGKVFAKRGDQTGGNKTTTAVNVTFRNIRITDKYQTLETFYISSKDHQGLSGAYSGIIFQNITSVKVPDPTHNRIIGHVGGVWDNITFDNVVLGGKKIVSRADFAAMDPLYVTNVNFINPTTSNKENKLLDEGSENNLKIYHDSASGNLALQVNNKNATKIQVVDLTGKVIFTKSELGNNESIDLSGITHGIYIVRIHAGNKISTNKIRIN